MTSEKNLKNVKNGVSLRYGLPHSVLSQNKIEIISVAYIGHFNVIVFIRATDWRFKG